MDFLLALYNQPRMIEEGGTLILLSGIPRLVVWWLSAGALAVISWVLIRAGPTRRYGWLGLGVCLVVVAIVIPGLARERIIISREALRVETGLWFEPTVIHYSLADFVRAHEVRRRTNWYRRDRFLILEARDGPHRRYRMSDFFSANRELIFSRLAAAGLEIDRASVLSRGQDTSVGSSRSSPSDCFRSAGRG